MDTQTLQIARDSIDAIIEEVGVNCSIGGLCALHKNGVPLDILNLDPEPGHIGDVYTRNETDVDVWLQSTRRFYFFTAYELSFALGIEEDKARFPKTHLVQDSQNGAVISVTHSFPTSSVTSASDIANVEDQALASALTDMLIGPKEVLSNADIILLSLITAASADQMDPKIAKTTLLPAIYALAHEPELAEEVSSQLSGFFLMMGRNSQARELIPRFRSRAISAALSIETAEPLAAAKSLVTEIASKGFFFRDNGTPDFGPKFGPQG